MTVRMGLIGVGNMGRHHARLLSEVDGVEFMAVYDPAGDKHGAAHNRAPLVDSIDEMLGLGIDAAVVAIPTTYHADVALQLAAANVHVLVEKPLAEHVEQAREVRDAVKAAGLVGAVGHVERCNPALVEMRRRLDEGQLGRVFSITTTRVGPFPHRIQDVGVVKDLATHDIDIVTWIANSPFARLSAQTAYKMGREHEDLVNVVGTLDNGTVASLNVNWVTPAKSRQVMVLGERGAFRADMLESDLWYYSNADVPVEWEARASMRGVSEGDQIRYAFAKREPLRTQLEHFLAAVGGDVEAPIVSLDQGVRVLETAEAILRSADSSTMEELS
jgi:UDP-N-acetylglucosamine 3-dehydrogenase